MSTLTNKVWTGYTIFITSELDLSRCKIEGEDGNCIRVLIGNDQELAAVIKLEVARCLSSRVKETNCVIHETMSESRDDGSHYKTNLYNGLTLRKSPPQRLSSDAATPLLHAKDRDRFVPTVGDNDKPPGLVHANPTTGVQLGGKCRRHRLDRLDQLKSRTSLEFVQGQAKLRRSGDLRQ